VTFKESLTNNIGWKIAGILLALALWFHLATEKDYEKIVRVEMEFVGLPQNMVVEKTDPEFMDIAVTATGKQLISLSFSEELKLKIDLSHIDSPRSYKHTCVPLEVYPKDHNQYRDLSFPNGDLCRISIKYKI